MSSERSTPGPALVVVSFVIDVALMLIFAALGRSNHNESLAFGGIVETALPFIAGAAIMWVLSLASRRPLSLVKSGLPIWIGTVVLGMVLRRLTGAGTAFAFVIVATITVGVFVLGWRAIVMLAQRLRALSRKA